jgi:branched-chain amino acid transport system substrate-binding protein
MAGVWWSPLLSNPQSRVFMGAFQSRYHREPEWYEALSYEAARAMFTAIEQAGSAESEAVHKALTTLEMQTLLPGDKLTFPADTGHQARMLFVVLQNQPDGRTAIIYPRDFATAPGELVNCGAQQAALTK